MTNGNANSSSLGVISNTNTDFPERRFCFGLRLKLYLWCSIPSLKDAPPLRGSILFFHQIEAYAKSFKEKVRQELTRSQGEKITVF